MAKKKAKKKTEKNATLIRKMCDRLWSRAVRRDWAGRCAICGGKATDAHHMIPRTNYATRFLLENGIALCQYDHVWNKTLSPHQNGMAFRDWINTHHPSRTEWFHANQYLRSTGSKTASYYCDVIRRLKQYVEPEEYTSIVGMKFSAWLDEQGVDDE